MGATKCTHVLHKTCSAISRLLEVVMDLKCYVTIVAPISPTMQRNNKVLNMGQDDLKQ
jgi:hypothetical protein